MFLEAKALLMRDKASSVLMKLKASQKDSSTFILELSIFTLVKQIKNMNYSPKKPIIFVAIIR